MRVSLSLPLCHSRLHSLVSVWSFYSDCSLMILLICIFVAYQLIMGAWCLVIGTLCLEVAASHFTVIDCNRLPYTRNTPGTWIKGGATGCATKCGVAAGKSGKPGTVTCSKGSDDKCAAPKPAGNICAATEACGT